MNLNHSAVVYMSWRPYSKLTYVGKTQTNLWKRVNSHIGQSLLNPSDSFHRALHRDGWWRFWWIPLVSFAPSVTSREVLQEELWWLRFLNSSLNTAGKGGTQSNVADSTLRFLNPNRTRPLCWVRSLDSEVRCTTQGNRRVLRRQLYAHLHGLEARSNRSLELLSFILRRPRSIPQNVATLRAASHRVVIRASKLIPILFHAHEQDILRKVFAVFWRWERIPVLNLKIPKTLNSRCRKSIWQKVVYPWMNEERVLAIRLTLRPTLTPSLGDVCDNVKASARRLPGLRK